MIKTGMRIVVTVYFLTYCALKKKSRLLHKQRAFFRKTGMNETMLPLGPGMNEPMLPLVAKPDFPKNKLISL